MLHVSIEFAPTSAEYLPATQFSHIVPKSHVPAGQIGVGAGVGVFVGASVGMMVGKKDGALVGEGDGALVGGVVGAKLGKAVGKRDGALVGNGVVVGNGVGSNTVHLYENPLVPTAAKTLSAAPMVPLTQAYVANDPALKYTALSTYVDDGLCRL